jgi:hypothetical protein
LTAGTYNGISIVSYACADGELARVYDTELSPKTNDFIKLIRLKQSHAIKDVIDSMNQLQSWSIPRNYWAEWIIFVTSKAPPTISID